MIFPPVPLAEAMVEGCALVAWLNLRCPTEHWVTRVMVSIVIWIVASFGIFLIGFVSVIVMLVYFLVDFYFSERRRANV